MQGKQGSTYCQEVRVQVVVGENSKEGRDILERETKANMWLHMRMKQGAPSLMEKNGRKQVDSGLWVDILELWLQV